MRLISVDQLESHMRLAKPIYYKDMLILREGVTDLDRFIRKFKSLGIYSVYIADEISDGIDIPDVVRDSTRHACKVTLQKTIDNYVQSNRLELDSLTQSVETLLDDILENKEVLLSLKAIRNNDESTYIHSISTTIYALLLAVNLGYDTNMLKTLAMGTVLHDIGKMLLNKKIIFKQGRLTEEEFNYVKLHTTVGYEALKKNTNFSELSRIIALYHHEKLDGSGYPTNAKSSELHPFVRIVTIADVYDALTSDRCYRKRWTAKEALDNLLQFSGVQYDTEFVRVFMQHIAIYPNGSIVRLSDRTLAIVSKQNNGLPERPVVRVVTDPMGLAINPFELDLTVALNYTIIESELDVKIPILS